jgi:hypothetical protein
VSCRRPGLVVVGGGGSSPQMRCKHGPRAEEPGIPQYSRACLFGFDRGGQRGPGGGRAVFATPPVYSTRSPIEESGTAGLHGPAGYGCTARRLGAAMLNRAIPRYQSPIEPYREGVCAVGRCRNTSVDGVSDFSQAAPLPHGWGRCCHALLCGVCRRHATGKHPRPPLLPDALPEHSELGYQCRLMP